MSVNMISISGTFSPVEDPALQRILEAADNDSILAIIDSPTDEKLLNLVSEKLRIYRKHFLNSPS